MCIDLYTAEFRLFQELSGAQTRIPPRDWNFGASAEKVASFLLQQPSAPSGAGTTWGLTLSEVHEHAGEKLLGCWMNGGRFWEADMEVVGNGSTLRIVHSVCAPVSCSEDDVKADVLPLHAADMFAARGFPLRQLGNRHVEELSGWDQLPIDFAIAGLPGCGTTSLFKNLATNPHIAFTSAGEDPLFFSFRALPSLALVRRVAAGRKRRVLGIHNPMMFHNPFAVEIMRAIPGLKVIIQTCDPVRHFEKGAIDPERGEFKEAPDPLDAMAHALPRLARQGSMLLGPALLRLRELFRERLFPLHQTHMRALPYIVFADLARALGAGVYPSWAKLYRYNSGVRRSGLCANRSLLRVLKRRLRPDYETIEGLLGMAQVPIPRELKERETYCDQHWQATAGPRCPWNASMPHRRCAM